MAADYERSTSATSLDRLPDAIRRALEERIQTALLTVPADAPAFLTHSRRLKRRRDGISIDGFPVAGERGTYFVGLGPPDGDAAREALAVAVRAAKA